MSNIQLTYFAGPGRAEAIRMALFMGGVSFDDIRLGGPEFFEHKMAGKFPLGSVPVADIDGARFVQTSAILRYAAKIGSAGLYPADAKAALMVDSALDTFNDTFSSAMAPTWREQDPAKKIEMRNAIATGVMQQCFAYVEGLIASSGGPFIAGSTLSIADLVIGGQIGAILGGYLDGISADHISKFTRCLAMAQAVEADPRVKAYRAK